MRKHGVQVSGKQNISRMRTKTFTEHMQCLNLQGVPEPSLPFREPALLLLFKQFA